jgi:U3 small nucleolar RNA-associated protein 12
MVAKTYLRYRHAATCGIVASPQSNILSWHNGQYAIAGALENVIVWDVRKGTAVVTLTGEKHAVTCMAASPDGVHIAVGYEDGTIRIWKVMENDCVITFSGHKSAVSALSYDVSGMRLASGSNDTHLIVWDVVAETGLYR